MREMFAKVRPQILLITLALGAIAFFALKLDVEVVGGCVGGLIALGMKVLEDKD